ncbi:hypothetical protein GPECTOR_3g55 [Gonium pectorale]|uniref:Uncharacterized protein n=1 Tax=Gonium pectorale TaxID=33097 RepID=A0A150H078_GONPE|nr:hypothetical protein GPECTOR_3g55 [Gonium pectorale]|eukprot:KXZ55403.1 hypothetical protein GPECTOR_3g55 [Gonium pectorale]
MEAVQAGRSSGGEGEGKDVDKGWRFSSASPLRPRWQRLLLRLLPLELGPQEAAFRAWCVHQFAAFDLTVWTMELFVMAVVTLNRGAGYVAGCPSGAAALVAISPPDQWPPPTAAATESGAGAGAGADAGSSGGGALGGDVCAVCDPRFAADAAALTSFPCESNGAWQYLHTLRHLPGMLLHAAVRRDDSVLLYTASLAACLVTLLALPRAYVRWRNGLVALVRLAMMAGNVTAAAAASPPCLAATTALYYLPRYAAASGNPINTGFFFMAVKAITFGRRLQAAVTAADLPSMEDIAAGHWRPTGLARRGSVSCPQALSRQLAFPTTAAANVPGTGSGPDPPAAAPPPPESAFNADGPGGGSGLSLSLSLMPVKSLTADLDVHLAPSPPSSSWVMAAAPVEAAVLTAATVVVDADTDAVLPPPPPPHACSASPPPPRPPAKERERAAPGGVEPAAATPQPVVPGTPPAPPPPPTVPLPSLTKKEKPAQKEGVTPSDSNAPASAPPGAAAQAAAAAVAPVTTTGTLLSRTPSAVLRGTLYARPITSSGGAAALRKASLTPTAATATATATGPTPGRALSYRALTTTRFLSYKVKDHYGVPFPRAAEQLAGAVGAHLPSPAAVTTAAAPLPLLTAGSSGGPLGGALPEPAAGSSWAAVTVGPGGTAMASAPSARLPTSAPALAAPPNLPLPALPYMSLARSVVVEGCVHLLSVVTSLSADAAAIGTDGTDPWVGCGAAAAAATVGRHPAPPQLFHVEVDGMDAISSFPDLMGLWEDTGPDKGNGNAAARRSPPLPPPPPPPPQPAAFGTEIEALLRPWLSPVAVACMPAPDQSRGGAAAAAIISMGSGTTAPAAPCFEVRLRLPLHGGCLGDGVGGGKGWRQLRRGPAASQLRPARRPRRSGSLHPG